MKPEALRGALERFAQFFIAPLCKADALEREVNAVHNEFTGARAPAAHSGEGFIARLSILSIQC